MPFSGFDIWITLVSYNEFGGIPYSLIGVGALDSSNLKLSGLSGCGCLFLSIGQEKFLLLFHQISFLPLFVSLLLLGFYYANFGLLGVVL